MVGWQNNSVGIESQAINLAAIGASGSASGQGQIFSSLVVVRSIEDVPYR